MINEKGKVFMDEKVSLIISFEIYLLIWAVALFLIAYLMFYKYLVQEKRCTAKTTGVEKDIPCSLMGVKMQEYI